MSQPPYGAPGEPGEVEPGQDGPPQAPPGQHRQPPPGEEGQPPVGGQPSQFGQPPKGQPGQYNQPPHVRPPSQYGPPGDYHQSSSGPGGYGGPGHGGTEYTSMPTYGVGPQPSGNRKSLMTVIAILAALLFIGVAVGIYALVSG